MRSGLWKLAALAACVVTALFVAAALSPKTTAGPCAVTGAPAMLRDVPESSGLAVSRSSPGLLWTHNDSGHEPDLFAVDGSGTMRWRVRLRIRARDWEDVSAAPCPPVNGDRDEPGSCLYIGDIGDNDLTRRSIQVYVVPEPVPGTASAGTGRPPMFTVTYPDGAHNAEAMFVAGGYLFIVTKDRSGIVYRSTAPLGRGGNVPMERVARLDLTGVTDAEASAGQESIAVRTSDEVVIYRTADLMNGEKEPQGVRIPVAGLREPQGEGVAVGADGTVYLTSEGRSWNRAGRLLTLRCPAGMLQI